MSLCFRLWLCLSVLVTLSHQPRLPSSIFSKIHFPLHAFLYNHVINSSFSAPNEYSALPAFKMVDCSATSLSCLEIFCTIWRAFKSKYFTSITTTTARLATVVPPGQATGKPIHYSSGQLIQWPLFSDQSLLGKKDSWYFETVNHIGLYQGLLGEKE